jgi:hypothetical protein
MTARTKKRIVWSLSTALGVFVLLGILSPLIPYKKVENWICPISGSTKSRTTWFGYFSHEERTVSALEQWLKRRELSFEPQWQHTSTKTCYALARAYACAGAPEIYQLTPFLDEVVKSLSDERIAGLVVVLRTGSRAEQRQVIQRIADEVFDTK